RCSGSRPCFACTSLRQSGQRRVARGRPAAERPGLGEEGPMTTSTTTQPAPPQAAPSNATRTPSLETGDHLTRAEFERRYEAMPPLKKAELIEGVVYMPSPVRWNQHAAPHADLIAWLVVYRASTPGVHAGDNGTIRLDMENEPQPDASLFIHPDRGGQAK